MQRYKVPDMTCSHCAQTIEKTIKALDAAAQVSIDLETKEVGITTIAEPGTVAAALREAGYPNEPLAA